MCEAYLHSLFYDDCMPQVVHEAMAPEAIWLLFPLLSHPSSKLLVQRSHILLDLLLGDIPGPVLRPF